MKRAENLFLLHTSGEGEVVPATRSRSQFPVGEGVNTLARRSESPGLGNL